MIEAQETGMHEEFREEILERHFADRGTREALIAKLLVELLARGVGVISLSESPDNLLMWAHYAASHKGFVVGFDARHPFLNRDDAKKDAVHYLRKVRYSTKRPQRKYLTGISLLDTYFTKSTAWQYEREWRMYTTLPQDDSRSVIYTWITNAAKTKRKVRLPNPPIHLFEFPRESVTEVIIGCRAIDEVRKSIPTIVREKYPQVRLYEAHLSKREFRLILKRISSENNERIR